MRSDDPYLALLEYRNTPTANMSTGPAERMLGRSTRSILPTCNINKTLTNNKVLEEKQKKKLVSQANYNKSAKDLEPLVIGSPVLLRDFSATKDKWNRWMAGKVIERLSDRSYTVLNEETGNIIRRNRVDLRNSPLILNQNEIGEQNASSPISQHTEQHSNTSAPQTTPDHDAAEIPVPDTPRRAVPDRNLVTNQEMTTTAPTGTS